MKKLKTLECELKRVVPFSIKSGVRFNVSRSFLTKEDKKMLNYFKEKNIKECILQSGWRKSGTTWTKFVVFNYFNILVNKAEKTLTFSELAKLDTHHLNDGSVAPFEPGFPVYYHTHDSYRKVFDYFYRVIYVYRNPLDAIISFYHNLMKRLPRGRFSPYLPDSEVKKLHDIDYFALSRLPYWIYHYKTTVDRSHVVMCYEKMKENPYREFLNLFRKIGVEPKENALRKSIELSSFENIKKMGRETNRLYGYSNPREFKGEFMRSGRIGQYEGELKPETVSKAKEMLAMAKIKIDI